MCWTVFVHLLILETIVLHDGCETSVFNVNHCIYRDTILNGLGFQLLFG